MLDQDDIVLRVQSNEKSSFSFIVLPEKGGSSKAVTLLLGKEGGLTIVEQTNPISSNGQEKTKQVTQIILTDGTCENTLISDGTQGSRAASMDEYLEALHYKNRLFSLIPPQQEQTMTPKKQNTKPAIRWEDDVLVLETEDQTASITKTYFQNGNELFVSTTRKDKYRDEATNEQFKVDVMSKEGRFLSGANKRKPVPLTVASDAIAIYQKNLSLQAS